VKSLAAAIVLALALASCSSGDDERSRPQGTPLELPKVRSARDCPTSPTRDVVGGFTPVAGNGPVYATRDPAHIVLRRAGADGWHALKVLWIGRPEYNGHAVVRGARIDAKGDVEFEREGSVAARLELSTERYAHGSWPGAQLGWRDWPSSVKVRAAGCYALQVDTATGSDTIVFRAVRGDDGEHVPIPNVSLPPGLSLDEAAWVELWRKAPGTATRNCVDVGSRDQVRSGQFIVSPFAAFMNRWDGTEETSKLAYVPLHPQNDTSLEVKATRLGTRPPLVVTLRFGGIVSWLPDGTPFYVTGTVLPERGRWRLEPVAGPDRGCFELQL
jgi:hypothetical protein